jgi:hypothetical protein
MKVKTTVVSLVLCFVVVRLCSAQDMNIGKWKLNEAKSKISQGAPKNTTIVYEAAGETSKSQLMVSAATESQRTMSGRESTTVRTTP